jgi:hypothetical protein
MFHHSRSGYTHSSSNPGWWKGLLAIAVGLLLVASIIYLAHYLTHS